MTSSIDRKKIESLLPHRAPMLLIDKLINIGPNTLADIIISVSSRLNVSSFLLFDSKTTFVGIKLG